MRRAGFASDLIVTTAGVLRGDYDVVKHVLARGDSDFWTVTMRPGEPPPSSNRPCSRSDGRPPFSSR